MGKVYLTGAGPGDAGLITVKALEVLREADIVIYDSLIARELLEEVRPEAELIHVGKRMGMHSKKQAEINEILVDAGRRAGVVVRLKGGDPLIFGRGGEEAQALAAAGIRYEVIPGVTSAAAVPASVGIPVTHRRTARSFEVITAHTAEEDPDLSRYAGAADTLVFLMGLHLVPKIAADLMRGGLDGSVPAAVISRGFTEETKVVRSDLSALPEKVREAGLKAPAIVVVGETAAMDLRDPGLAKSPRIGAVGTIRFFRNFRSAMGHSSVRVEHLMRIQLRMSEAGREKLRKALEEIETYRWVTFASQNAIEMFFREANGIGFDRRRLSHIQFACVGEATAEQLKDFGYPADYVPPQYTSEALALGLADPERAGRVLAVRADRSSPDMDRIFRERQIPYTKVTLYQTEGEPVREDADPEAMDWIVFASASGVRLFNEQFPAVLTAGTPGRPRVACIGDYTAMALRKSGIEPDRVASPHTAEGLAGALDYFLS
ncbi:uroporphyrinogen III methyltransferase / synthase [Eubacterium pyruvativorans]|uniref:uroporphyrinogen-III C-methyltransferase n=1 Tax=Eubacterium pyruvativorans TaxID=155865 RepID=A0A1I7HHP6_9FIRM|nr:uroporphyrinogen-III C-methyltransferase [Eubacterium pyruvativorans]SFO26505.1 uroporphyrinogen III methyltransferase / synthase [Eubacterium pyruvativorans]SFU60294.1 uroporphyrinogen III methyltransferase / synthase [Eubacterium pyruvativorans]HAT82170.1 uroporphyrinogen-III C-methyltransferase [Eubacterium sp.]